MTTTTTTPAHRLEWKYGVVAIVSIILTLASGMYLGSKIVGVDGLNPVNTTICIPADEVANPASHTDCDAKIDSLRVDALWGSLTVLVLGALIFGIRRLLKAYPQFGVGRRATWAALLLGILFGGLALDSVNGWLEDIDVIQFVFWNGAGVTAVLSLWLLTALNFPKAVANMQRIAEKLSEEGTPPSATTPATPTTPTTP